MAYDYSGYGVFFTKLVVVVSAFLLTFCAVPCHMLDPCSLQLRVEFGSSCHGQRAG
jgi:hypothetical protein